MFKGNRNSIAKTLEKHIFRADEYFWDDKHLKSCEWILNNRVKLKFSSKKRNETMPMLKYQN